MVEILQGMLPFCRPKRIRFMMANNLRFPEIPPAFFPLIGPEFALIFYAAKDQR